jgi:hypothetical protein
MISQVIPSKSNGWTVYSPITDSLKLNPSRQTSTCGVTQVTIALHWSPSWARPIQHIPPRPFSRNFILILFTFSVLIFLVVSFLLVFPPVTHVHSPSPYSFYMFYLSHSPSLDDSNYTWPWVKFMKLLARQVSPTAFPITASQNSCNITRKTLRLITWVNFIFQCCVTCIIERMPLPNGGIN